MKEDTIKGLIIGVIVGAIATTALTIGTGWAVLQSEAEAASVRSSQDALVEGYAAICAARFQESASAEEIEAFKIRTTRFEQSNYLENNGWATMPGAEGPYRSTPDECADLLSEVYASS